MIEDLVSDVADELDLDEKPHMPRWVRKKLIWVIVIIISLIVGGIGGWKLHAFLFPNKDEVTVSYVSGKLADADELTTQTITYTSGVPIEKGKIPFITKRGFTMYYTATLRAGVHLSEIDPKVYDKKVVVTLYHSKLLGTPNIDANSIQFKDETKALLNWDKHEDVKDALKIAKKDVKENPAVDYSLLLNRADEHAEELVHALLDDCVGGREVVVRFR